MAVNTSQFLAVKVEINERSTFNQKLMLLLGNNFAVKWILNIYKTKNILLQ